MSQFDIAGISCQICPFSAFYNQRGVREAQLNEGAAELAQEEAEVGKAERKYSRLMRSLAVS